MHAATNSPKKPRWHQVYYLLAALDLLTIFCSLMLSNYAASSFDNSVSINKVWADRVEKLAEAGRLATAVNAPGNDVFTSLDFRKESEVLDDALTAFRSHLDLVRQDLSSNVNNDVSMKIMPALSNTEHHVEAISSEAHSIFEHLKNHRQQLAGQAMSRMDRSLAMAHESLGNAQDQVRAIQSSNFNRQLSDVASLKDIEYGLAVLIVFIIGAVICYGHLLSKNTWKAQLETSRLQSQLNAIVESSPHGILLINSNMEIVLANAGVCELFGYTQQELMSRDIESLLPQEIHELTHSLLHPDQDSGATGKPDHGRELLARRKSGTQFCVEVGLSPLHLDGQNMVLSTIRDITNRKAAEKEIADKNASLAKSQAIFRTLIDQSFNFVGVLSLEGILLDANRTSLKSAGIEAKSVLGRFFWETPWWMHSSELQKKLKQSIKEAAAGNMVEFETTHPTHEGDLIEIAFSLKPVRDEDGKVIYLIPEGRDITQHKRREAELQELLIRLDVSQDQLKKANATLIESERNALAASHSKSEFLANMSHEIRTPMTAILGYSEILINEEGLDKAPPERIESLQTIQRNGNHLLAIINDILDLSKIEAGKMAVESVETNTLEIVYDVVSLMKARAENKNIDLKVNWNGKIPSRIECDPVRLRQCLINFVGNGIKFTEIGSVTIEGSFDDSDPKHPMMKFDIIDTGIGMTKEQSARLFQPFAQADTSTTRRFGGTGLGLVITKRLAELMGGGVSLQSQKGVGSTFTMSVATGPLDDESFVDPASAEEKFKHNAQTVRDNKLESAKTNLTGCRVLLAEDGPDNQRLISFLLKNAGADVSIVENGRIAVEQFTVNDDIDGALFEHPPFDVILMDMQMPEMDGYTAAKLLKRKECPVPIIALTAHAMAGEREKCLAAGCDDYATKPIDRIKLTAKIEKWWEHKHVRRNEPIGHGCK